MSDEHIKNQELIDSIYTTEKKKIWDKKIDEIGKKFQDGLISSDVYMELRAKLRTKLGFPI